MSGTSRKSSKLYLRSKEAVPGVEDTYDFFETSSCIMTKPNSVVLQSDITKYSSPLSEQMLDFLSLIDSTLIAWYPFCESVHTTGYTPNCANSSDGATLKLTMSGFTSGAYIGEGILKTIDGVESSVQSSVLSALQIKGDLTIVLFHNPIDTIADKSLLISCQSATDPWINSTKADNPCYGVYLNGSNKVVCFHESGTGTLGVNTVTSTLTMPNNDGIDHFIAVRRNSTAKTYKINLDDLSYTGSYLFNPTGGTNNSLSIPYRTSFKADGLHKGVMIFNRVLSDDELNIIRNVGVPQPSWFNYSNWNSSTGIGSVSLNTSVQNEQGTPVELQAIYSSFTVRCSRLSEFLYFIGFFQGKQDTVETVTTGVYSHRLTHLPISSRQVPTFTALYKDDSGTHLMTHCLITDFSVTLSFDNSGIIDATFNGVCNMHKVVGGSLVEQQPATPWVSGEYTEEISNEPLINTNACCFYLGSATETVPLVQEDIYSKMIVRGWWKGEDNVDDSVGGNNAVWAAPVYDGNRFLINSSTSPLTIINNASLELIATGRFIMEFYANFAYAGNPYGEVILSVGGLGAVIRYNSYYSVPAPAVIWGNACATLPTLVYNVEEDYYETGRVKIEFEYSAGYRKIYVNGVDATVNVSNAHVSIYQTLSVLVGTNYSFSSNNLNFSFIDNIKILTFGGVTGISNLSDSQDISSLINSVTIAGNNGISSDEILRADGSGIVNDVERKDFTYSLEINTRKDDVTPSVTYEQLLLTDTQKAFEIIWKSRDIISGYKYALNFVFPVIQMTNIVEDESAPINQALSFNVFADSNGTAMELFAQSAIDKEINSTNS